MGFGKQRWSVVWAKSFLCLRKLIFEILLSWTILCMLLQQHMFLNWLELTKFQRQKWNLGGWDGYRGVWKNLAEIRTLWTIYLRKEILRNIKICWKENTTFEEKHPNCNGRNGATSWSTYKTKNIPGWFTLIFVICALPYSIDCNSV